MNDRPDREVVLITGFGDDGRGGTYALHDSSVSLLDPVACTGLSYRDGRVARLIRAPGELTSTCELIVSDARGVVEYHRLDAVRDPHDVFAVEGGWIIVSTGTNEILRLDHDGLHALWSGTDVPDACHVNCVTEADGDLWATAFGWFASFKGWRGHRAVGAGVLWNIRTGAEITGLSHPHTPRFVDREWFVCESISEAFVQRDALGRELQRVALDGYTRGVAFRDHRVLVGVSARRDDASANAHVAVVDRRSFTVLDRIPLPCSEVYDLAVVPAAIADGIRGGFVDREVLGPRLDRAQCSCRVRVMVPATLRAGEPRALEVEIENTGTAQLVSRAPYPVFVASRWIDEQSAPTDGDRVPLPCALAPGARALVKVPIEAPASPGRYQLVISLVQEGEFWFDEIDTMSAARDDIDVR
jgi:hypothetical protein